MRKSRGRGIIRGRKCPRIQTCPTCGQMRVWHPGNDLYNCPTPKEAIEALRRYKAANGTRWKAKLKAAWKAKEDLGPDLEKARVAIGPHRLHKITL